MMKNIDFKVLLVYPNPRKMSLVPGSLALFSALLKNEGVKVDIFDASLYKQKDFEDPDEYLEKNLTVKPFLKKYSKKVKFESVNPFEAFCQKVQSFEPDLLAVTCVESTFAYAISLLKSIQNKRILTILGGVFASFSPEYALSYNEIDIVCIGDGERALVELVNKLRNDQDYSNISNLYIKKNGDIIKNKIGSLTSLDDLPIGDFEIFNEKRFYRAMAGKIYKMVPVETHRGCLNNCAFCNSPLQNKMYKKETGQQYFRAKSISNVYEEIKYFVENFQAEYIFFWADNFFAYPVKVIEEFCEMYSEFKLPFFCQSYPVNINEKKLQLLYKVGLKRLSVGIEHGNETFRKKVINRNYKNETVIKNLALVNRYDIELSVNNIIGFPDETPDLVMDTIELNRAVNPHTASCSVFSPFRGTYLRELCIKKGYLKDKNALSESNDVASILEMPQFKKDQIEGKRRTFEFYIRFPKKRWKEIALAENISPEGNKIWKKLSKEYTETYV